MTVIERALRIMQENGIMKKTVADAIGVPTSTFQSWVVRNTDFPASYLLPFAQALRVSPMYLLTGDESARSIIPNGYEALSQSEQFLINTLRSLDFEGATVVINKAIEELRRIRSQQGNGAPTSQSAV